MVNEVSKNGKVPLPESQEIAVRQGLTYYQEMAAERNALAREVGMLKSEIAAHKVVTEAQQSQITELESRMATARIERDRAVEDRAEFRTILKSIQAQLRAFGIEHDPLVRLTDDQDHA